MAEMVGQTQVTQKEGFDSSDDESSAAGVDVSPLRIDWLDLSKYNCTEPLGISALPGCRFKDTWRSLESDIGCLKANHIQDVFVLCTQGELHLYRTPSLLRKLGEAGMQVHHTPFGDGQAPPMDTLLKLIDGIRANLTHGKKTLVHCFGGLGRSCLVVVCLLMVLDSDLDPDAAMLKAKELRGPGAIQSVKQYNFVQDFRTQLTEHESTKSEASGRSISR